MVTDVLLVVNVLVAGEIAGVAIGVVGTCV
jgi:hypothetical protein